MTADCCASEIIKRAGVVSSGNKENAPSEFVAGWQQIRTDQKAGFFNSRNGPTNWDVSRAQVFYALIARDE
jgi:hypothetical protein